MGEYSYLLYIAIILISTKVFGLLSRKVKMPQVVGALVAGILLGPSALNLIPIDGDVGTFISYLAELGVIFLMFSAGLETDMEELKKNSFPAFVVASIGVIVPVACGFLAYAIVFKPDLSVEINVLKAVFVGVVLSATSVSITVETLRELGKLGGKVGTTILGAAVIDDILGIIVLTIVSSLQDQNVSIAGVLVRILLYFMFIGIVYFVVYKCEPLIDRLDKRRTVAIFSFVFCLVLSYVSERFFGIADITGAYFAGLMLCNTKVHPYVEQKTEVISYMFFSPVFFVSIGLKTSINSMTSKIIIFAILLLTVAVLSKVIGCGIGAKVCRFTAKDSLQVGVGMISRGEVALIVAQKGYQYGMMDSALFGPVVLVVIVTTLITPILLKLVMSDKFNKKTIKKMLRKDRP